MSLTTNAATATDPAPIGSPADASIELLFIDIETVCLAPRRGSVWEVAWATLHGPIETIQIVPDLAHAEIAALEINRFVDRYDAAEALSPGDAVERLDDVLIGSDDQPRYVLAGSAPWFDADHLNRLPWDKVSLEPGGLWHHHHVDVPTLAAGRLGPGAVPLPARLSTVARAAEFILDAYDRHTAAGDVALTRDLYLWWKGQSGGL
jgi:hypothetical protein